MGDELRQSQIRIERPLYDQEQLRNDFIYEEDKVHVFKKCMNTCNIQPKKAIVGTFPIVKWLSNYNWKTDLLSDIISGFTVAIMHIPQGMAYALLGNVPPIVGIYMAFFPVLVYTVLGTSRHNSMGTFAVVCLMTGKAVLEHSHPSFHQDKIPGSNTTSSIDNNTDSRMYTPVEVATAVTLSVAIFQFAMYLLRLGAISAILSDTLVNGFTTGAAVQVLTSQLKDLFGLRIPKHKGYFTIINICRSIIQELNNINYAAAVISVITIGSYTFSNMAIKPAVAKYTSFPVPIELIIIVAGTVASTSLDLDSIYGVRTVGDIPTGLPTPSVPHFELIPSVILDGFTIAIVSYTVTLSMALIFAQKLNYEVDANQELLAQGAGNVVGSFFSCMPFSASLSRSMIQQTVGGKTQIASAVSCVLLLFILLWIGPFFEPLPKSVLASLIVVALKGMLFQITSIFNFWNLSKVDALIWLSTFLTVVFVSIDIGLLVGILVSLAALLLLGLRPYTCLLGQVPGTDLFLDSTRYKRAVELPGVKIFHYCGPINFATRAHFTEKLYGLVGMNPRKEIEKRNKTAKFSKRMENGKIVEKKSKIMEIEEIKQPIDSELRYLILDFSSVSYMDPCGARMLKALTDDFKKIDIIICIAACPDSVYNMMQKCDVFEEANTSSKVYPSISDAIQAKRNQVIPNDINIAVISRL